VVRSSRRLVEAALVLALAGCGEDLRIDVRYRVIGRPPVTAGSCPTASAPPTAAGATKVRFTFRDRPGPGGAPGALRCDVVVARTAVEPVIAVPRKDEPVDLWVEYFDDAGALIARGSKTAVTLTGGDDVTIYAGAAAGYGCAPTQTTAPRAFHSATLLPTGEVLLFGGLTGGAGAAASADLAPAAGAYVTASAEIYDPVNQRVFPLTLGIAPRAFHQVIVLGTAPTGQIVLAVSGGVGVNGDPAAAGNVAAIGGPAGEAPWRAVSPGGTRAGTAAVPAEILLYDPIARTVTRTAIAMVAGQLFASGGADDAELGAPPLVGGGVGAAADKLVALSPTGAEGPVLTGSPRVGAVIVRQSATDAIWLGGATGGMALYDRISGLGTTPTLTAGPALPGVDYNRAFAAAARVGGEVFAFGGLRVAAGAIGDDTSGVTAFRVDGTGAVAAYTNPALVGTAYGAAVTVPGPAALVAGGVVAGSTDCTGGTLACVSPQSARVDPALVSATGAPGLARYGHRLTRLTDGTVLVSGGFTTGATAGTVRAVATLELFEPHRAADDPIADLGLNRAPGDVARVDGAPVAPCGLVRGAALDAAGGPDAALAIDGPEPDAP
jgi:hypothetical protein